MQKGKNEVFNSLAPRGRGRCVASGEGNCNEKFLFNSPSSVLWTSSPSSGEASGGFTLIELLVVVLIIGILAAVAVPQYNKAVEKARLMQQIVTVRALYNALEVYRMENGQYPPAKDGAAGAHDISYFNDLLDIQIQTDSKLNYYPSMFISQGKISANWYIGGGPGTGKLLCNVHPSDTTYEKNKNLCLSICTDKEWRTWVHGEYCII